MWGRLSTRNQGAAGSFQGINNSSTQFDDLDHELGDVRSTTDLTTDANESTSGFYDEVSSIRENLGQLNRNVSRISQLRSQLIHVVDGAVAHRNGEELEELVEATRALCDMLKRRIQVLERQTIAGSGGETRRQQTRQLKSRFLEEIQNYHTVEQQHRQKYIQEAERQYRILKPDASPQEIRAVANGDAGHVLGQVADTNRSGTLQTAYLELQEKIKYIQQMKHTLLELAQLFNDINISVVPEPLQPVEEPPPRVPRFNGRAFVPAVARANSKRSGICGGVILLVVIGVVVGAIVGIIKIVQANNAGK